MRCERPQVLSLGASMTQLPQRSELDLRIDVQRMLLLHATTPEIRAGHCRRLNELLRQRAAQQVAERNENPPDSVIGPAGG